MMKAVLKEGCATLMFKGTHSNALSLMLKLDD